MIEQIQRTTVKGILMRDNKILLVKDTKGVWELPGGRIDFGETPNEALKREFNEELGWDNLTVGDIIDAWSFQSIKPERVLHFIVLVFTCFSNEERIVKSDEHSDFAWIPIQDVDSLEMKDGYKNSIKKLFNKK